MGLIVFFIAVLVTVLVLYKKSKKTDESVPSSTVGDAYLPPKEDVTPPTLESLKTEVKKSISPKTVEKKKTTSKSNKK